MTRLQADITSQFARDYKKLKNKHVDMELLKEVMRLVVDNSDESLATLRQRHNMHRLSGEWLGSHECHIANTGDWLLIWRSDATRVSFQRTGKHDDLFRG